MIGFINLIDKHILRSTKFLRHSLLFLCFTPIAALANFGPQKAFVKAYIVQEKEFFEKYEGVGQVKFAESQYITAKTNGTIEYVTTMQGQPVKKDDVIISLSEKKARQALAKAEAELESAESSLKRDQSLFKKKIISEDVLDKSKVALERSKLELITAKEDLEDLIVTAPFDGIIGVIKPRLGDEIKAGDKLFTIITPSKKEVTVELPQTLIGKIDDKTVIYAYDFDNKKITGNLQAMSSYLSASGTVSTKLEFDEGANLIHDSYIKVHFEYNQHKAMGVPEKTVMKNNTGNFIYQITEENKAKQLYIDTGVRTAEYIEVISDNIKLGDKVILEGLTKVFEGIEVSEETRKTDEAKGTGEAKGTDEAKGTGETKGTGEARGIEETKSTGETKGARKTKGTGEAKGIEETKVAGEIRVTEKAKGAQDKQQKYDKIETTEQGTMPAADGQQEE